MATSGTVGSTIVSNATVIDHAVRRCGLTPSTLTPEQVETSLNNLYFVLTALVNRGVNLWCVTKQTVGLKLNQVSYQLPIGTIDVLNANYRTATPLIHTLTTTANSVTAQFAGSIAIKTVGILFGTTVLYNLAVEVSHGGEIWSRIRTLAPFTGYAGSWLWFDLDPSYATTHIRVVDTQNATLSFANVYWCNETSELPMTVMNRDSYTSLPNKTIPGTPLQYLYDKQTTPVMHLWPSPDDGTGHLVLWTQRQIQDIGTLQDKLEIPERWFEAIIWQLARNLSFELPGVEKDRRMECVAMAGTMLLEAEDGETDGTPIYLQPNISGYTR